MCSVEAAAGTGTPCFVAVPFVGEGSHAVEKTVLRPLCRSEIRPRDCDSSAPTGPELEERLVDAWCGLGM